MAEAPANIVIAGTGTLYVAAVGSTLPDDHNDTIDAAFTDMGILQDDGAMFNDGKTAGTAVHGWGRREPYRKPPGNSAPFLTTVLREWHEDAFPIVFGGGTVAAAPTDGHVFTPPANGAGTEYAVVLDMSDGSNSAVVVVPRCVVVEATEVPFKKMDASNLALRFDILVPTDNSAAWRVLVDHPGFTVA